ncbi:replication initiator protein A [Priestia aryabhattai]
MKKQYITKGYIKDLTSKEKATGVYFNTPKVIYKGEKYRKALSLTQKAIYQELWDISMKAAHKGQVDEKGRVYIEVADSFIARALDISEGTVKFNLNGKGKNGKYTELFDLGLITIKKRVEKETSEYYVMAPVYEGVDKAFLTNDITTPSIQEEASAKRNKSATSKREQNNEQLEERRKSDTVKDTAHYEVMEREFNDNMPDFDEPVKAEVTTERPFIEPPQSKIIQVKVAKRKSRIS